MCSNYPWIKLIRVVWRFEEKVENLPSSVNATHRHTKQVINVEGGKRAAVKTNEGHSPKLSVFN